MSPFKKMFGKKLILVVALVLILSFKFCSKKEYTEFPKLKIGKYHGHINIKKNKYDFFIDKDKAGATVAIISLGDTAKRVELSSELKIEFPTIKEPIKLIGQKVNREFNGEVLLNNKPIGSWYLKKTHLKNSDRPNTVEQTKIGETIKEFHLLKKQLKSTRNEIKELNSRVYLYKNVIPKEEKLRSIAVSEVDDLSYSIEEKQKIRKQILREIKNKVTDLEQLQRITASGRSIDLARRTTKREDRWYLANWGEEGVAESEQQIADSLGIDISKLAEKLQLAEEYLNLKNSISFEARKIEEFKNAKLITKQNELLRSKVQVQEQKHDKKDNSIWNKFGDLFDL